MGVRNLHRQLISEIRPYDVERQKAMTCLLRVRKRKMEGATWPNLPSRHREKVRDERKMDPSHNSQVS